MTLVILSFASGVLFLQLQPELPVGAWIGLAGGGILFAFRPRIFHLAAAFAVGFAWALGMAHVKLADRLAPEFEGRDIDVVGVISSLPAAGERSLRFEFEPESSDVKLPARILLSWYRSPPQGELREEQPAVLATPVHPGERWKFTVRLRRPHGNLNPHGFDYEAWLLERGIGATGYVRSGKKSFPQRLGTRNSFRDRFKRVLGETPAGGILAALAVGDQRSISAEEWRLFNRTGVTHLMRMNGTIYTQTSEGYLQVVQASQSRQVQS